MRKTWILNLLLLAVVAIAGSRTWSYLQQPPPALPQASPAGRPAAVTSPAPAEEGASGEAAPPTYDEIVARDLFSALRGVVPPAAPRPAAEARPAPKPQPQPKVTLYGVVILDGEKSAFLQEGTQEAKPRKVREGESFAGGTLTAIRPDGVTLLFGGSEVSIPLRTPKEGGAAALPRPPGPAQPPAVQPGAPEGIPRQTRQPGARFPEGFRPPGQQVPPRQTAPRFVPTPPVEEPIPEEEFFPEDEGVIDEFVDDGTEGEIIEEEMQESP